MLQPLKGSTIEGMPGTVGQLFVDVNSIMQQVKQCRRNSSVTCYVWNKAYGMVHHECMILVCMCMPEKVCNALETLMRLWKEYLLIEQKGLVGGFRSWKDSGTDKER